MDAHWRSKDKDKATTPFTTLSAPEKSLSTSVHECQFSLRCAETSLAQSFSGYWGNHANSSLMFEDSFPYPLTVPRA